MNTKNNLQNKQPHPIITAQRHQAFSGPIPHPELVQQYELIAPGFANRILAMAENEAKNRQENETRLAKSVSITTFLGISFAFMSVLVISFLVYYALSKGFDRTAGIIAVGSIAAVASVFIFFRRSKQIIKK